MIIHARTFVINTLFLPIYICDVSLNNGQSLFCCCHAVFQGVSRWLNNGVHLCVDVSVGQCTRHNLHRTNHIEISIQRIEC